MAQLPSAFSCQRPNASCTLPPVFCTAKSTIVVMPPHAAAIVPVSNVSHDWVPPKGISMWVCTSTPPGTTYLPVASMVTSAATPRASACPGARTAATVSPSISTSAALRPAGLTTVPPEISVRAMRRSRLHEVAVGVRPAIAVERPTVADRLDHVHVEVPNDQLRLVGVADVADELALRIHEVALTVEVVVADVGLDADAVDRPDVVHVRHRRGRLLDAPDVLRQAAAGGRRVEHDLGAVEPERPPALGEVAVVADVDADLADGGVEHRVPAVARPEVELLPEALHLGDVLLAELAEVGPVGVDDRRSVVVDPRLDDLVHRQHHHHAELPGDGLEALRRRPVRDGFGVVVVGGVLDLAEVRAVEELLEADDLGPGIGGLAGRLLVLVDHGVLGAGPIGLQQGGSDGGWHGPNVMSHQVLDNRTIVTVHCVHGCFTRARASPSLSGATPRAKDAKG